MGNAKIMCIINANAVQGCLSENYLTQKFIMQILAIYGIVLCSTFSGLCAPGPGLLELSEGKGPRM